MPLVQLVEHPAHNRRVSGSSPQRRTKPKLTVTLSQTQAIVAVERALVFVRKQNRFWAVERISSIPRLAIQIGFSKSNWVKLF